MPEAPTALSAALPLLAQFQEGTYEAHLTVEANEPEARARFVKVCQALGVQCVLIELSRGVSPSQPMTSSVHHGTLPKVAQQLQAIAAQLQREGFAIVRTKLEASLQTVGVPQTQAQARALPWGYFEFHHKLSLPKDADLSSLLTLCQSYGSHLSRNNRKRSGDTKERFVTQRVHQASQSQAKVEFEALSEALREAGYTIASQSLEFTIFDSRAQLDAGWLDEDR